mmetsp:Transcript_2419/g.7478  ORF Transcript_2419/g.7478 Transcript_2419/m.7478 type:complete len:589 (-) Transcript_2419:234-2000(-)
MPACKILLLSLKKGARREEFTSPFLEGHNVSCQLLVVVRLPLGIPVNGVADPLPVGVVLLVQPWVACSELVDDASKWNPLAAIRLLVEHLRSSEDGWKAASLDSHLPGEVDVVIAPPSIIDFVVSSDLLPDLLWEGRVHSVEVSPWLPPLLDISKDVSVAESVVSWLEVVGLAQDSWVPLRLRVVAEELVVGAPLGAHEDSLGGHHVRHGVWLGRQELVHVLQEVLVQDHVAVHADDVIVLGLLDAHVSRARDAEGVGELSSLDESKVELGAVLLVDRVNVVGGVVVDDDDLELEVGLDLLLHEPGQRLLHDALLVERREHAAEVDSVRIQVLHVRPRVPGDRAVEVGLDSQGLLPRGPGRQAHGALLGLVVGLVVHDVGPLRLERAGIARGLVINEEVPPDGGLVAGENHSASPLGTQVGLDPVVLLLGALRGEVRVRGRDDEDVVSGGRHGLDGVDAALVGLHVLEEPLHSVHGLDLGAVLGRVVLGDVPVQALARGNESHLRVSGLHSSLESLLVVAQGVVHVDENGELVAAVIVLGLGLGHDGERVGLLQLRGRQHGVVRQPLWVGRHVWSHGDVFLIGLLLSP